MPTTLAFSKAAFTVAEGSPAKITAVMTEALAPNGVIVGATVTCTLSSGQTVTAVTDGTATATCTLSGLGNGQYSVSAGFGGDHNYLSSSAATEPLFVYQPTTFVIWGGNQPKVSDAIRAGMDVNFWGAKWTNQVTAGAWFGGAGFKGFADTASATTWSVTGGSAKPPATQTPPATIGQYIGVIVTTSATQSGSTTNGNIAELIVLKSDDPAGYKATPGQPANGIVQVVIS